MPAINFLDIQKLTFISIFLMLLVTMQLTDPDYFWHLKTGEYILTHGELPRGDIFSFTKLGQPWILHEWLFEVVLYALFKWQGVMAVKVFAASLATTLMVISNQLLKKITAYPTVAFCFLLASFIPFCMGISPRPQLVTYIFLISFIYVLLSYKYLNETRCLVALPLIMLIWVNAHGVYMLGLMLLGIFVACEWGNYWIAATWDGRDKAKLIQLTKIALATLLMSSINPWFVSHWLYPFQVMNSVSCESISEWQSPNFHQWSYKYYLILVLIFFTSYIYKERKPDLTELIIPIALIVLGFVAVRNIPLATLVITPFIVKAISSEQISLINRYWQRIGLSRLYKRWFCSGKQLGSTETSLNWLLLVAIVIGTYIWYPSIQMNADKENRIIPVKAVDFISNVAIPGRIFNTYHYGGYLIYRLYPSQHVFIDGRVDMYGDEFYNEYLKIMNVQNGWKNAFDKYKIDYVITDKNEPLSQLLQSHDEFRLVYEDQNNSVLVRNSPRYAKLIETYGSQ